MTIAQLEQRVAALEKTVERLETQLTHHALLTPATDTEGSVLAEEDIIPGAEYPVILSKLPTKEIRLRGIIRETLPARKDLGLSDAEIALFAEEEDE